MNKLITEDDFMNFYSDIWKNESDAESVLNCFSFILGEKDGDEESEIIHEQ